MICDKTYLFAEARYRAVFLLHCCLYFGIVVLWSYKVILQGDNVTLNGAELFCDIITYLDRFVRELKPSMVK